MPRQPVAVDAVIHHGAHRLVPPFQVLVPRSRLGRSSADLALRAASADRDDLEGNGQKKIGPHSGTALGTAAIWHPEVKRIANAFANMLRRLQQLKCGPTPLLKAGIREAATSPPTPEDVPPGRNVK